MEVIVCRAHPVHISSQIKTTDLLENVRSEKNLQKVAIGKLSQHADIQIRRNDIHSWRPSDV